MYDINLSLRDCITQWCRQNPGPWSSVSAYPWASSLALCFSFCHLSKGDHNRTKFIGWIWRFNDITPIRAEHKAHITHARKDTAASLNAQKSMQKSKSKMLILSGVASEWRERIVSFSTSLHLLYLLCIFLQLSHFTFLTRQKNRIDLWICFLKICLIALLA